MKRSTCKLLIGFGLLIMVSGFLANSYDPGFGYFTLFIAFIFFIIGIAKWGSEKEHEDVKKAQIKALERGKVNVELKSNMRKLG